MIILARNLGHRINHKSRAANEGIIEINGRSIGEAKSYSRNGRKNTHIEIQGTKIVE